MGIEVALAQKYIQMLGGSSQQLRQDDGSYLTEIRFPSPATAEARALAA
jgi:hypothetical protein